MIREVVLRTRFILVRTTRARSEFDSCLLSGASNVLRHPNNVFVLAPSTVLFMSLVLRTRHVAGRGCLRKHALEPCPTDLLALSRKQLAERFGPQFPSLRL